MLPLLFLAEAAGRSRSSSGGSLGCFVILLVLGLVLYVLLKGRRDRPELLGAAKRGMGSGSIPDHTFASPYAKCPTCSASGERMKQQWDGLRKVTWTCGYCGNVAGVQELKDEELPPSARQRLGLDAPLQGLNRNIPGNFPGQGGVGGGGVGGLLTGMMIGSMLGGGNHNHQRDDWGNGDDSGSGGDSGSDSDGGWGDSGGGDSGGDSGGGDW